MRAHDIRLIFALFVRSSRLQQKRAILTIAAIAWGTVAILLLLAFGEGLKLQLGKNQRAMGENISVLWPGETTKAWKGLPPGRPIRPTMDDIEFLRKRMPDVKNVIGEITEWGTPLVYGRKTVNARITGANWEYGETRKHYPQRGGRFINAADERDKRRVIFLGDEMAKEIFGAEDPIGKTLLVNNSPYNVIGVMQYKRQMGMYGGPDSNHAIIPITTFRAQFGRDGLSNLLIETHRPEAMKAALHSTFSVLGSKYSFDPDDERTFGTWDTVKSGEVMNKVTLGIQLFLGIIGALTLLIGGVGVANIMYAVVKERTREIGVKMALGARGSWITGPFVLEGLVYTLIGGALGISIATLVVTGLSFIPLKGNQALEFLGHPTLSWQIGIGTAAILGLIGVLAGYFPARRASSIDPAATLRYE